ncbi:MAG: ADP-heptose:LPS heptosyltransferase [Bacteroidia bacterium]|jgi:ADP-heptose:LPS heptosyltransferase
MKILIIRLSSIGDIVLTTPVIRCTRAAYPDAEIHFLIKKSFVSLVEHNPNLNTIKPYEKALENELVQQLQSESYDLVIDLHKNVRTRRLIKTLNTKSISYNKENIRKWLFVNFKIDVLPDVHIVDRYFASLKRVNILNDNKGIDFFYSPKFQLDLSDYSLVKKEYTVITVGGTYFTKQIPERILMSLFKRLNGDIVLIGAGKSDATKAEQLTQNIPNKRVYNLCNQLSIEQSAYLIENAKSIITSDTGMMHIAAAFDTPIEAIWGNTNPSFGMYAYRPQQSNITNHKVQLNCNPCSKLGSDKCPRGHFNCMNMQNVEQIVKN